LARRELVFQKFQVRGVGGAPKVREELHGAAKMG